MFNLKRTSTNFSPKKLNSVDGTLSIDTASSKEESFYSQKLRKNNMSMRNFLGMRVASLKTMMLLLATFCFCSSSAYSNFPVGTKWGFFQEGATQPIVTLSFEKNGKGIFATGVADWSEEYNYTVQQDGSVKINFSGSNWSNPNCIGTFKGDEMTLTCYNSDNNPGAPAIYRKMEDHSKKPPTISRLPVLREIKGLEWILLEGKQIHQRIVFTTGTNGQIRFGEGRNAKVENFTYHVNNKLFKIELDGGKGTFIGRFDAVMMELAPVENPNNIKFYSRTK